tara:strand:+ start:35 stop:289 length:255 start_codon:yes stop_codon:yes gene_type:complete
MNRFRLASVKHAEYEIYKGMLVNKRKEPIQRTMQNIFDRVVPKGDKVALKRWNTAINNVKKQMENKMENRKQYLPKNHIDGDDS